MRPILFRYKGGVGIPIKNRPPPGKEVINTNTKRLTQLDPVDDVVGLNIKCLACGKTYLHQKGNFYASYSPLYKNNNSFVPICKNCVEKLFKHWKELFSGVDELAMERLCQAIDMYWSPDIWLSVHMINATNTRIGEYIKKLNLRRNPNASRPYESYDDSIRAKWEDAPENITSLEDSDKYESPTINKKMLQFWGLGFETGDYELLAHMYGEWVADYGEPDDKALRELYKTLCYMQLQIQKGAKTGANVAPIINSFRNVLEDAGLKPKLEEDVEEPQVVEIELSPLGKWVQDIEQFTPAEFYKNKKAYKDFDGIGGYIERFFLRPLRNTFIGTNDADVEFSIAADLRSDAKEDDSG